MTVIDKILNEWSFRCPDGIVDLNDLKKVKILFEILREDIDDDLLNALVKADTDTKTQVLKFIKKSTSKSAEKTGEDGFYNYLNKHNLTPDYIGTLSDQIFEILSDNDDLDKFNEYRKSPLPFSSLAQTGNIVTILSETGVSQTSIDQLLNLIGSEGGRGIGKGEILLALFFGDAKISEGKGDITASDGAIEIKGSNARLGERGTNTSMFTNSDLARLAIDLGFETAKKGIRIDTLVSYLSEEDNDKVYDATVKFLKNIFTKVNIEQILTPESIKSDAGVRVALKKMYILNYFAKEGMNKIMYIDTAKNSGQYVLFTPEEVDDVISNNLLKIKSFFDYDMNPQLG